MGKDLAIRIAECRDNEFTNLDRLETLCTKNSVQGWKEFGARLKKAKLNLSKGRRDFILEVKGVTEILVMTR